MLDRQETQHQREIDTMRKMYIADMKKKEAEMKTSKDTADLRIKDRNSMYDRIKAKEEEMKNLETKVIS